LGWVLFSQRKYDAAVEILREQTKINPFDDYSYNLLGRVLWVQQKFVDAEASFRKQLEISPLDKFTHGNLGQMYVEWRKYKEAVPELEKAISLNPENEFLQVSLGRAYLNLGETEKATEAFDQASKLAPGPPVWNDVAYNLSIHKVALDRAEQYAESAVTAMATGLRNVELTRLTIQDLASVANIAAYWDTLGWVEYQRGNIDLADKYISAAWLLNQHSEVGYHLGQILEKRGKNADAVRIYALATAADRLYPEARESLARLGGKDKVDSYLSKAQQELRDMRTVKLPSSLRNEKESAAAEFYVVLKPGAAQSLQVADVKFIRGNQKLEPMATALRAAHYNLSFPNESSTRLIRRGTLTCKPGDVECSFVMFNPEEVVSVD
jgi:tetratricopeptide (TPR) repeat protein